LGHTAGAGFIILPPQCMGISNPFLPSRQPVVGLPLPEPVRNRLK